MMTLTKIMREKLQKADLEHGEINDVSLSTICGLEERGLVNSRGMITTTQGGNFPKYSKVKLSKEGLRTARMIQGRRPDV
jgi:hypothetical protein